MPPMKMTTKKREAIINDYIAADIKNLPRGGLAATHRQISSKYNMSFEQVKSFYYDNVRDLLKSFEEKPVEEKEETNVLDRPFIELYPKNSYVLVKVTRISHYGANVHTMDSFKTKGLIHISNIDAAFVESIEDYFKIDQMLVAKILNYNEKEHYLALSTIGISYNNAISSFSDIAPAMKSVSLKEYSNITFDMDKDADKKSFEPTPEEKKVTALIEKSINDTSKPKESEPKEEKKKQDKEGDPINNEKRKELDYLMLQSMIENTLGIMTPASQKKLDDIIQENGYVSSALSIKEHLDDFSYDPTLIFLNQIEKKISQHL